MDRHISAIIRGFSILLGINCQENRVSGLAIQDSGFSSLLRSLGLRHGGGSSLAGLHVAVATARVSSANWRPAAVARRVSRN
jgi:hypothetical protein